MLYQIVFSFVLVIASFNVTYAAEPTVHLGPRPFYLVDDMDSGPLKDQLKACKTGPFKKSSWSIGHRGAALKFPEHTKESYIAAAKMDAGIIECDVTFTKDKQLVCRHSQNDLHTTTDILQTSLASTCKSAFAPASDTNPANAECRTSEISLAEFKTLKGKNDAANKDAKSVERYLEGAANATLMTHAESIELIKSLGSKFTPELKAPSVTLPFEGYTQQMYAQAMIEEYKKAGIPASDVFPQSFNLKDVLYWIKNEPKFGNQAVWLDASFRVSGWSPMKPETWIHKMSDLKAMGVNYIAPPMWVLVTDENGKITPSIYAKQAKAADINIIAWTAERSGSLKNGGGWYYQSISNLINNDGDVMNLLHTLHKDVGIKGLFSDWPVTTTYYANCFGLN